MCKPWQKSVLLGLAAWLCLAVPVAGAGDILITVTGVRNSNGNILACLWFEGWGFPDCDAFGAKTRQTAVKAEAGSVTFMFTDVPDGKYAVSVAHDQNGDGKLDRHQFFGYPVEGAGVSNFIDAPRFVPFHHDALFEASGAETSIVIPLHYP